MLLLCEIKKLWKRSLTRWFVVFAVLINCLVAVMTAREVVSDPYYIGKEYMLEEYGGRLTKDKVEWITSYYHKMEQKIQEGSYSVEKNKHTYTGYEFSDYNCILQIFERLQFMRSYNVDSGSEYSSGRLKQSSEFYKNVGNHQKAEMFDSLAKLYANRTLTTLQDDSLFYSYEKYRMSFYLLVILAFVLFTGAQTVDVAEGMASFLHTTEKGNWKLFFTKDLSAIVMYFVIATILLFEDVAVYGIGYGGLSLDLPLYEISGYELTAFPYSVGMFVLYTILIRLLGGLVLGLLCFLLAEIFRRIPLILLSCFALLAIGLFSIPWSRPESPVWWNPLSSFVCMSWFKKPLFMLLHGKLISYPLFEVMILCGYVVLIHGLLLLICKMERR